MLIRKQTVLKALMNLIQYKTDIAQWFTIFFSRLHDIAVGAPFHTDYTSDAFETGCVYIDYQYTNQQQVNNTLFKWEIFFIIFRHWKMVFTRLKIGTLSKEIRPSLICWMTVPALLENQSYKTEVDFPFFRSPVWQL